MTLRPVMPVMLKFRGSIGVARAGVKEERRGRQMALVGCRRCVRVAGKKCFLFVADFLNGLVV